MRVLRNNTCELIIPIHIIEVYLYAETDYCICRSLHNCSFTNIYSFNYSFEIVFLKVSLLRAPSTWCVVSDCLQDWDIWDFWALLRSCFQSLGVQCHWTSLHIRNLEMREISKQNLSCIQGGISFNTANTKSIPLFKYHYCGKWACFGYWACCEKWGYSPVVRQAQFPKQSQLIQQAQFPQQVQFPQQWQ